MKVIDHGIFNLQIGESVAVMDFNPKGDRYPSDLVNDVYARECKYIEQLSKYAWAPKNVHLMKPFRQIYFQWHSNTCEDHVPEDYKEQLEQIVRDLHSEKVYKPSFYPKYFYTDDVGQLHSYAFYSSSDYSEQPIAMDFYRPILNPQRKALVEQIETNGTLDMGILVKYAFTEYIKWPGDPLPEIYRKVYQSQENNLAFSQSLQWLA